MVGKLASHQDRRHSCWPDSCLHLHRSIGCALLHLHLHLHLELNLYCLLRASSSYWSHHLSAKNRDRQSRGVLLGHFSDIIEKYGSRRVGKGFLWENMRLSSSGYPRLYSAWEPSVENEMSYSTSSSARSATCFEHLHHD